MAGRSALPAAPHDRALHTHDRSTQFDPSFARREPAGSRCQRLSIIALAALLVMTSALVPSAQPASAETPLGPAIPFDGFPFGVAVNPTTGRVYVAHYEASIVTVFDGATNAVVGRPTTVGRLLRGIDVNPATNRIYVASEETGRVTVIDGATNAMIGSSIQVGAKPFGVAVNPATNRIYVTSSAGVHVIDGATNIVVGPPIEVGFPELGDRPFGVAVNSATNRIYAVSPTGVTAIDGATNTVVAPPIPVGQTPLGVAVNATTNTIYAASHDDSTVTVIDGTTNTVIGSPIPVGAEPFSIAVNPAINRVFVPNSADGTVSIIDGATRTSFGSPLAAGFGSSSVAINPLTNRVYVPNVLTNNVSVIGIPLSLSASRAGAGSSVTATWSAIFGPDGADFLGLFQRGAPNTSPLGRVYTNGTASPGGSGLAAGSVTLPIPAGLASDDYEVRLVSGVSGGAFARSDLAVASAPVAANDGYTVGEDRALTVPPPGVLANDADADSPTLRATVGTRPTHGTLFLQENGAFTYTSGFTGTDSFTYQAVDQTGLASTATVTVAVAAAPSTTNDAYTVNHGSVLTVAAPGVLANDTDADSPTLQAAVLADPANGTLTLQPNGAFSYTPRQGFTGTDRFTYRVADQTGLSATATVTITVAPVACGPRPTIRTETAIANGALQVTVTAADANGPTRNRLKELRFAAPVNGRVELAGQSHTAAFSYAVPAATDRISFAVRRVSPGQATTVPLTVVDECGSWPTFVGGGTGAGF